ncbi:MAG: formylmethanofuran dehydrogenase subunit C, partial [Methylococcaceae bacterium]|nr:formylmethanofuran dehydrogenase subunit C [Methylococcaceae bacterium]
MTALTLTLKQAPVQRVDMSPLVCQQLTGLSVDQIAALTLQSGKQQLRVDALFTLDGTDTQHIIIKNSHAKLDFIGKGLDGGNIDVEGDAGAYLGLGM